MIDGPIDTVAASAGEVDGAAPDRAVVEPGEMPLRNRREEDFAEAVAAGVSQRQAYVLAGYGEQSNNAPRLAAKPRVSARISYLRREFNDTVRGNGKLKLAWLQAQYVSIATADPTRDRDRLCKVASKIEIDAEGKTKFEIDRQRALDSLTKTVGGFITRAELTGADGGPLEVEAMPSIADRARALAAFLIETKYESAAINGLADARISNATRASHLPPTIAALEPETALAAAKRALLAAGQAAQVVVGDGAAVAFLIAKLRGLADAVEAEAARAATRSAS
jgi:hypothetical protein